MPNLKLTQIAVDKLKPPQNGRTEYWDNQLPGFGLRVYAPRPGHEGRKTWQVLYRISGKQVRETLGTLATIPKIADARELARLSMQKAQRGINLAEERRQAAEGERQRVVAEEARQRDNLAAILDRYVQVKMTPAGNPPRPAWRPDTLKEITRSFDSDVKPKLGKRPVQDITRRDVRDLIEAIVARGRAPHAHHVLAYLRPALNWAVDREIITVNPAAGISDPDPRQREARTRDRYLEDDEIRLFWLGCDKLGWPFGPLFKLLLLTGQRRDELAEATWPELNLGKALWTLPRQRAKNDKAHLVHLSPLAIEIIEALPQLGRKGLIFTTTGDSPVSGFGRARDRLAAKMIELRQGDDGEEGESAPIAPFTLHDLRRTAATGMARIGIAHHVLDRVLNHTGGKISGVGAIYNRFEYLDERKTALDAWSRHVESLVRPGLSNVVMLAAARRE